MAEKCLCGHIRSRHKWGIACQAPDAAANFAALCSCRDFRLPKRVLE